MQYSLVAFDTDQIQAYVFATDMLKEIRGASSILDTFNRQEMPRCVGGTCYYAHGGSGLFVVPTADADACVARVRQAYAEATGGAATITGVRVPLPEYFDVERDNIQGLWKHLGYKLRAAKARNPEVRTSVTHPLLHFGHADGTFYATQIDEENELISAVSVRKRERNQEIRLRARRAGVDLPEDFAAIADVSSLQNYFALIYADGDGMGKVREDCTTLPEIHTVATGIDDILKQVKDTAIDQQRLAWKVVRTLRPYTAEELRRLIGYRQTLRRMPRSKLAALRQAVFQPRMRAMFEALRVLVHWRDDKTRAAAQEMVYTLVESRPEQAGPLVFPFVEGKEGAADAEDWLTTYSTPIADLAELWDFIPGGSNEE